MAKIKNISGDDRVVPWLGDRLVIAGTVVEVPLETVMAYTQQEQTWEPADQEAQDAHDEMLEAIAALIAVADEPTEALAEHSAADLIKVEIPAMGDTAALLDLQAAELDRSPRRKTVLAAINERIFALADPVVALGHEVTTEPPGGQPDAGDDSAAGTNDTPMEG